jgi:NAD(P)H-nitrite reductase large subunit
MKKERPEKAKYEDNPDRKATYAPYIPKSVLTVDELMEMAVKFKEEGAEKVKLGGELIFVWDGKHLPPGVKKRVGWEQNHFKSTEVRPIKICSAETFCMRYRQPVLELAEKIDNAFRGTPLPAKLIIGIAGCQRSCSEPGIKDIGIISHTKGYELLVGGSAGLKPRIAQSIGLFNTQDDVMKAIGGIIEYVKNKDKKLFRLGKIIENEGIDGLLNFLKKR